MTLRDDDEVQRIIVVLNQPRSARYVLDAATLLLARLPGCHLELHHPRPDVDPDYIPTEEIMTDDRRLAFERQRDGIVQELSASVADWQRRSGCRDALQQSRGRVREVVAAFAKGADLVVAGVTGEHYRGDAKDAIEAVLFEARAPLLLVPRTVLTHIAQHVAVAWERSQAADEAIEAALPLLSRAERVTILVARERHVRAHVPNGIMQVLEQQGHAATLLEFDLDGRDIGTAILAEARGVQADMLVMGAFTHLRTVEALFGGATRDVMAGTHMPLMLHH